MLIKIFKSNQKLVNAFVLVLAILLWLPSFFIDREGVVSNFISTNYYWLDMIIAILLISFQAIYINIIVNEFKLIENNTHLTSLIFVVFNSCLSIFFNLNEIIIANCFVLLAVHQTLKLYDNKGGYTLFFNAGFLISTAALIYTPYVVFLLLIFFALFYLITPQWRDFVITLIGFSVPIFFVFSFNFFFDYETILEKQIYPVILFNVTWGDFTTINKSLIIVLATIVTVALLKLVPGLNSGAIKIQKMLVLVVMFFLIGLTTLLLNNVDYLATFIVLIIPTSIIVAKFFQQLKKQWLSEIIFATILVLVIGGYFS